MKRVIAMSFVVVLSLTAFGADRFTIVDRGRSAAQIVTGVQPPETVVFAAKELQSFVQKMSGAELSIASQARLGTPAILLGPAAREQLPPSTCQ